MKYFLFIYLMFSSLTTFADADLDINQGWIQEGPPNARVLAGFMVMTNPTSTDIIIKSATSDSFKRIEFHRTLHENGMARMRQQPQLTIKAGGSLTLEHGGYHLMMFQPASRLKAGDQVKIHFQLSNNKKQSVTVPVKTPQGDQQGHAHHHHH